MGKFRLGRWLGSSDHSAVFFTELTEKPTQKPAAAVKLISAENLDEVAQLSRWASAARLSHPHLLRLFEYGRCQIDDTRLLYVVMEYAEENLAEVLPLRPLSASEAADMLRPTAEALAYLHQAGFAHSRIKPSNIMAVDNRLKISADGLQKTGERGDARTQRLRRTGSRHRRRFTRSGHLVARRYAGCRPDPEGAQRRSGSACRTLDDSAAPPGNCAAMPAG